MISAPPRPYVIIAHPKAKRLRERPKGMTIAIGMLCAGGMIVAADKKEVMTDGSTRQANKVCIFDGKDVAFAIADASDDANAAQSLVRKLFPHLAGSRPKGFAEIECSISNVMSAWYTAFAEAPKTSLIAAIILKGCGHQLYLFQPPNTVLPQAGGYVAAGIGASVTDPLFKTLFNPWPKFRHPQTICREIAYLMYHAKRDNAYCGGPTDAVYLNTAKSSARWLNPADFKIAEESSFQLDQVLNMTATNALSMPDHLLTLTKSSIIEEILRCEKLRGTVFHDESGEII